MEVRPKVVAGSERVLDLERRNHGGLQALLVERDDRVRADEARRGKAPAATDRSAVLVVPLDLEEERQRDGLGQARQLVPAEEDDRQAEPIEHLRRATRGPADDRAADV